MDAVLAYEGVDYTQIDPMLTMELYGEETAEELLSMEKQHFYANPAVDKSALDDFLRIKKQKDAAEFFLSYGPLLYAPPRYAHSIPVDAELLAKHADIILEAVDVMRFALLLRCWITRGITQGRAVCELDKKQLKTIWKKLDLTVVEDYKFGMSDEAPKHFLVHWERNLDSANYRSWLAGDLATRGDGRLPKTIQYEGAAKAWKKDAKRIACSDLLDKLTTAHLKDVRLISDDGRPRLYPQTLLSALWLVAVRRWTTNQIKECPICHTPFLTHRDESNPAKEKKFCSKACRQKNYRNQHKDG